MFDKINTLGRLEAQRAKDKKAFDKKLADMLAEFGQSQTERNQEIEQLRQQLQERFEILRNNPDLLAAQIAANVRREHTNVSAQEFPNHDDEMLWFQGAWGEVREKFLVPLEGLYGDEYAMATCATTGCIAGHAGVLAGYKMLVSKFDINLHHDEFGPNSERPLGANAFLLDNGEVKDIPAVASNLLKLDAEQQGYLFAQSRTVDEVLEVLDVISLGHYDWFREAGWDEREGCYKTVKVWESEEAYQKSRQLAETEAQTASVLQANSGPEPVADWERELLGQNRDNGEDEEPPF